MMGNMVQMGLECVSKQELRFENGKLRNGDGIQILMTANDMIDNDSTIVTATVNTMPWRL